MADDPEYVGYAREYLVVTGLSLIGTAVVVPIESVLRSVGEAKMPTYVSIAAIIVNVFLNAVLIFGLLGFPQWGYLAQQWGLLFRAFSKLRCWFTFVVGIHICSLLFQIGVKAQ